MVIKKKKKKSDIINRVSEILNEGLWDNIHAKRKRGESPSKPGDKDYPDKKSWEKAQNENFQEEEEEEEEEEESTSYKVDLSNISEKADEINNMIDAEDNLPSWVQDKITIANHNMEAIEGYFKSNELSDDEKIQLL